MLEERANLGGVPISVILCVVGAGIGFLVTRLNDWIVESREFRRASRHLRTEAANVIRHYTITQEKLAGHETEVAWRNVVNLEIGRFYGSGLGTFDMSALRLFDEPVAEEAMYLMLTIRNNNAYIDQAKLHLASGDKEQFHDVCQELTERCQLTIERARRAEDMLRSGSYRLRPPIKGKV